MLLGESDVLRLSPLRPAHEQQHQRRALGVSVRTLQEWEQGRRAPSGAARTLLVIAAKNPRALVDVA